MHPYTSAGYKFGYISVIPLAKVNRWTDDETSPRIQHHPDKWINAKEEWILHA